MLIFSLIQERKIGDLQIQLTKYQAITVPHIPSISTKKDDNCNDLINNHNIQKTAYEADDDISDSNSIPSINSDKDSQVNIYQEKMFFKVLFLLHQQSQKPSSSHTGHDSSVNSHQNPLAKLKLDVLHRVSKYQKSFLRSLTFDLFIRLQVLNQC